MYTFLALCVCVCVKFFSSFPISFDFQCSTVFIYKTHDLLPPFPFHAVHICRESILTKPHNFLGLHTSSHHCPDYFNKQLNQNVGSHLYFSLIVYSSQDNENLGWLSFFFVTAFHCIALIGTLINKITSLYHYTYISSFLFYFFFSFFFYINNAKKRSQSWLPK